MGCAADGSQCRLPRNLSVSQSLSLSALLLDTLRIATAPATKSRFFSDNLLYSALLSLFMSSLEEMLSYHESQVKKAQTKSACHVDNTRFYKNGRTRKAPRQYKKETMLRSWTEGMTPRAEQRFAIRWNLTK